MPRVVTLFAGKASEGIISRRVKWEIPFRKRWIGQGELRKIVNNSGKKGSGGKKQQV